jgi:hypothetical protein
MNWKSMMLCAGVLIAGSTGLVACGDDEDAPCETDGDCAQGEVCIGLQGARECEVLCKSDAECTKEGEACIQVPDVNPDGATVCDPIKVTDETCETNDDCTGGATCVDGFCSAPPECSDTVPCAQGLVCESGTCVTAPTTSECQNTGECLDGATAYCADLGGGVSSCLDVGCGDDLNSCGRCALGPNGGNRDSNGPVLFAPEQVGTCRQDSSQCLPGAAPYVCEFAFFAFDQQGDLPATTSGLNSRINVISRSGSRLTVFGTGLSQQGNNTRYTFRACFPETTGGNIGTAIVMSDNGGNDSQTLCVDGRLR